MQNIDTLQYSLEGRGVECLDYNLEGADLLIVANSEYANYWNKDSGVFGVARWLYEWLRDAGYHAEWRNPEILAVYAD